ncbi:tellurite resistance TerB family protein [Paenibacillus polysaccharolyticus]|jgi:tellurite resistance protein TerB|uniref:Tellurite resistance protein TerB n=2 Tax=Paenibacillus TaxID=44249 RepID=A0A1G5FAL3_9BACL|nr:MULTISPECIES: tellurite resistance TerB family protein [Paenibacillus]MDP9702273.1 tellurite resistance protein TerB [Paenibacillus intestini]MBY0204654.1 tellurite resistance TerB family protein [Paenibacillus cucumis (ex Kampfer et al. 2016)]MCP1135772.1 tellurite resistance TerB family protein [Paenibacillus polysaccharolyticus]MDT0121101.1 tellurite resistance TerB family protein [Paenibacillus sp. RRE4]SCY36151.1 tellurite resistance protein TerB [Paenibacillus polysaccharolyticus]
MSAFKNWLNSTKQGLEDQVKRFKNKDFMDAVVAGCALVAFADGSVDASEKNKMAGYINLSQELKVFDMTTVIERFNHYVNNFEFSPEIGKQEALKAIAKFKSKPEVGRVIVGVCSAIGAADGNFDDQERRVVAEICTVLGLNPGEFSL